jgi:hypothetical protein
MRFTSADALYVCLCLFQHGRISSRNNEIDGLTAKYICRSLLCEKVIVAKNLSVGGLKFFNHFHRIWTYLDFLANSRATPLPKPTMRDIFVRNTTSSPNCINKINPLRRLNLPRLAPVIITKIVITVVLSLNQWQINVR